VDVTDFVRSNFVPGKQPLGIHPKFIKEVEGQKAKNRISLGVGLKLNDW